MTGQFGVDSPDSPTDLLEALAQMDATVTELGPETVRGVETTRYQAVVDLETAAANLPPEQQAELAAEMPGGLSGELPVDVWIDNDGLLRRLVIELDEENMASLGAGATEAGSATVEFELYDVGEPMSIEAPPVDQVITADELGFNLDGGV